MKYFTIVFFLLLSVSSNAEISSLFSDQRAILIIRGSNTDVLRLYDAMNVQPVLENNMMVKNIKYETLQTDPVFDLTCKKSLLTNSASCTLKFFPPAALIQKDQKSILMGINDPFDAPDVAQLFHETSNNSHQAEIFLSEDQTLRIWKTLSAGKVISLTMMYN